MSLSPADLQAIRERAEVRTFAGKHAINRDTVILLAEVERLTRVVDATDRQLAARNGENAGERLWHDKADQLQARLDKVQAMADEYRSGGDHMCGDSPEYCGSCVADRMLQAILGDPYPPQAKLDEIRKVLDGEHPDTD